jgi:dipeptidase D
MTEVYTEQYGEPPVVQAIHAGVECGLFSNKMPDLDCVSFGPNLLDIHTPSERMEVESVRRTWNYLVEVLKRLK